MADSSTTSPVSETTTTTSTTTTIRTKMRAYTFPEIRGEQPEAGKRLARRLVLDDTHPMPTPQRGHVIVRVKAFAIHREDLVQTSHCNAKVPGRECVGVIHDLTASYESGSAPPPGVRAGTPVLCLLGGLGSLIDGTYSEFVSVPLASVFPITLSQPDRATWTRLASVPLTYVTALAAVDALAIRAGERVLVRGGRGSALAIVSIASALGAIVATCTAHTPHATTLSRHGASAVVLDKSLLERADAIRRIAIESSSLEQKIDRRTMSIRASEAALSPGLRGVAADVHMVFAAAAADGSTSPIDGTINSTNTTSGGISISAGAHKCIDFNALTIRDSLRACCPRAVAVAVDRIPLLIDSLRDTHVSAEDFGCKRNNDNNNDNDDDDDDAAYDPLFTNDEIARYTVPFDPAIDVPSGVRLTGFDILDIPLHRVPFQDIVDRVSGGVYRCTLDQFFAFGDLNIAIRCLLADDHVGTLVVVMDDV